MKIRALVDRDEHKDSSAYYWRIDLPFKFMKQYGIDIDTIDTGENVPEDIDVLVLPKMCVKVENRDEARSFFKTMRDAGIKLVYDADDDMWSEAFTQYMVQLSYKKNIDDQRLLVALVDELEARREASLWTTMQCDAITVTNKRLARYTEMITNKPVFSIENAI